MKRALLVVTTCAALLGGCADAAPGGLSTSLTGPQVEVSTDAPWHEVRFTAHAQTSAPLLGALVRVHASSDQNAEGQVRVLLSLGSLNDDTSRSDSVLPLDDGAEVDVPREAFAECLGDCIDSYTVVLSAEGIPSDVRVSVPVQLEAELFYADEAPADDSVELTLTESDRDEVAAP